MRTTSGLILLVAAASSCGGDSGLSVDPDDVAGSVGRTYAGTTVTLMALTDDAGVEAMLQAYQAFQDATGITIQITTSQDYETELIAVVEAGTPPDIAFFAQPGLLTDMARAGKLVEEAQLAAVVGRNDVAGWQALGTVDGKLYGVPFGANVKSLVWYSPPRFAERGYAVPTTWADLLALSDRIVADGATPWCVGMESGDASGWPGTDWVEDLMLRTAGPVAYDKWVAHEIPFDDPDVVAAFDEAAKVLKNEAYIKGGVASEATTSFFDSPAGLLDGSCFLHRQASFAAGFFPDGTRLGPDGDVDVFYFPGLTASDRPVLGGGDLLAAFSDRPAVTVVLTYLTSADYANRRAAVGGWLSPNKGLDVSQLSDPTVASAARILQAASVFRFDASDEMPFEVNLAFWQGILDWLAGASSAEVTATIEATWPQP